MAAVLECDGCGAAIKRGPGDEVNRLRLLTIEAGPRRSLFDVGTPDATPTWDFCNVHCLATWALQQETETVR